MSQLELIPDKRHSKSVFADEQELLKTVLKIHIGTPTFDADPMYFKGNFYKEIQRPPYTSDISPQMPNLLQADARQLPIESNSLYSMILDPPFMFGGHGKQDEFYSSRTHGLMPWEDLQQLYKDILTEANRVLCKKGVLVFKCQDYTDSKTTMTHALTYNWAIERGFYAKDLAILVKPNKVTNPNTTQRHLRKIHTYFWVFIKEADNAKD